MQQVNRTPEKGALESISDNGQVYRLTTRFFSLNLTVILAYPVRPHTRSSVVGVCQVDSRSPAILGRGKTDEDEVENGHRQA